MSRLVATQTAAQRLCEHRVCDHLKHHTGWAADLCFFGGALLLPPAPRSMGHPTAGQEKRRADLHPAALFLHSLYRAKPCTVQHPRTGTELDGSALIFYIYWRISHLISLSLTWYHSLLPHDLLISNEHTVQSTNLHGNLYKCGEVLFVSAV